MRRIAWLGKRTGAKGRIWHVYWTDDLGRQRSVSTRSADRRMAETVQREVQRRLDAGELEHLRRVRLSEFSREVRSFRSGELAEATLDSYEDALMHLTAYAGDVYMDQVGGSVARAFLAARRRDVKAPTANKTLRTLKALWNLAVKTGSARENPFTGIKPAWEAPHERHVFTPGEISRLLEAAPAGTRDRWRAFILLALTTGMRTGEILHLRWEHVDMEAGEVRVACDEAHRTKGRRARTVPLAQSAAAALAVLLAQRKGLPWVFTTQRGTRWANNVRRVWRSMLRRAGLPMCRPHDMRVTCVTALQLAGAPISVAQEIAGHRDVTTTRRYYTQIMQGAMKQAVAALPFSVVDLSNPCRAVPAAG